ncbi:MAG: GldG family protein [Deltaproteobacteria bacterium]|nr:GldG family protein [Deltaproteobacteria bacterium]MBW2018501.1 GldG family protein [Deltaproteobacteria bacterium]MBW2073236.1 GldG family protein [Deltaproteobacteria bacterium]
MARIDRAKLFTGLGYAGFIIIVATAITYGMIPAAQRYTWVGWIVGLLCLIAYVVGSFNTIRDYFKKRSARYGVNAFILILLVLGILVFVEAISARHSARFDLTASKRFTLSEQTLKILKNLEKPVRVTAFYQEASPQAEKARDLLDQYAYASRKFSFDFVDPDRFPGKARRYKITTYGTLVLETDTREEKITQATEQELTNALLRVTRKGEKVIYFMTGHDEKSTENYGKDGYSGVKKAIEDQNYAVRDLLLMRAEKVPADASVLIIAGPKKALFPEEIFTLKRFIDQGGHLLILIDPETDTGLSEFLRSCGIEVGQDVIVDKLSRLFGADYLTPIVSQYAGYHPITENFKTASFFPLARSISVAQDVPQHVQNIELAKTGPSSWAETDLVMLKKGKASFDNQKDTMGPIPVAVVSTIRHETTEANNDEAKETVENKTEAPDRKKDTLRPARIVVFGDSDFAGNTYLNLSGNRDLFMNTISWLAEEEDLIAIRPKKQESQPVVLSYTQGRVIFWTSVVLLPAAVLIIGIVVLRRRRIAE